MENQGGHGREISFASRLTRSEVQRRMMMLPVLAVAAFFEYEEGRLFFMDVKDSLGQAWIFLCRFHANEEMGNYFCISWPQFSMEKGLKENDEVIFTERPRLEGESPERKFKVEIKRKIRLFGVDMWGELNV
ncbi:hypothetical protein F3Y22_tig00110540pilonHSYRG00076 [Hibiscus syriacus]|uniref:TF-B3 domain-containing protein n=1 Tax=Hibiscus syriacus TaxID=106335 RepID=A0A6A3ACY1_HIBSY|nr:hypothetical protein F3Y22_tig00110540pilonHSYRG00076 [Hibiscus syriacus]